MNKNALYAGQIVLGLVLLLAAEAAYAWDLSCQFEAQRSASIDSAGATAVEIVGRAGDLVMQPATGATVSGRGRACASSEEYLQETQVHARREGNVIQLYVQTPDSMSGLVTYASLDLTVEVPANLPVRVTDTSGDLSAHDISIRHITDSSGDIELHGLKGDLEINDSSGDIRVENSTGLVRISDSSGGIFVHGARDVEIPSDSSGEIVLENVSGSVRIDQDSSGDIRIAGVGKDVTVLADSSGDVHVTGVKGTVQIPRD